MRYLLVDRIVEWEAGKKIRGVKNVAMSEDFLEYHFPKNPVMPGVLLLEAMAQLAGWLEAASSDFQNWCLIERVHQSHFYGFAYPGDRVEIEVEIKAARAERERTFAGVCKVEGKKKVVAEFDGKIVALAEIDHADARRQNFRLLTRSQPT
ncbi:MAG: 3-hydroxyacyl-ACP dehydratase FabZ family protein [Candidatus Binatia bacterium]